MARDGGGEGKDGEKREDPGSGGERRRQVEGQIRENRL